MTQNTGRKETHEHVRVQTQSSKGTPFIPKFKREKSKDSRKNILYNQMAVHAQGVET